MDKQRLLELAGVPLTENFDFHGEEVTDDNFDDIKRRMVQQIEDELGPEGHEELKQAMLNAPTPQALAGIMVAAIKSRR